MDIHYDEASLLALFLETLFYGIFLTLYLLTLFILLTKTGIRREVLIPVATLLLCIAIISFVRALEAFVFDIQTISPDAYYNVNFYSSLNLAKVALYVLQTTLADVVIVWRCYVLNHRSLLVAVPGCIALLTNMAAVCYIVWSLSQTHVGSAVSINADICITIFYALTMVISVACTSLIVWRICQIRPFTPPDGFPTFLPVVIVIVESGALYATSVLALLITFSIGSNAQYIVLDVITPIVGIAFCLIILQVHFQAEMYGTWLR
ncbi:hypothetical protein K503DRAFT_865954 [Rhizopogon vinicolor AM-OR11-026]|uniref:Uncharacterized protein n=1 Tax=Rhizopogon vinicolor AM-OR11-026 TaxID=1314800 RepID=A0A1B7N1G8_9AGAM|nr:hypothetical protein K503DRAFT_865954 [Rhizopogon vinicolor AM-OR11-026]